MTPPDTSFASTLRGRLRAATADLHAELDARMAPLLSRGAPGYGGFLLCSAAALFPIEEALADAGVARILPDWRQRARSAALRADLAHLSLAEPAPLPAPEPRGEAVQLGMVYVLEGSRLGARLLWREALARLGPRERAATRYLAHGEGLRLWPSFLARLEGSLEARREPGDAVAGARAVFNRFLEACARGETAEAACARG